MVSCSAHILASIHSQDHAPITMTGFKCEFCTEKKIEREKTVEKKGDSEEKEITKQRGRSQKTWR